MKSLFRTHQECERSFFFSNLFDCDGTEDLELGLFLAGNYWRGRVRNEKILRHKVNQR